jgi:hypothetical protein
MLSLGSSFGLTKSNHIRMLSLVPSIIDQMNKIISSGAPYMPPNRAIRV